MAILEISVYIWRYPDISQWQAQISATKPILHLPISAPISKSHHWWCWSFSKRYSEISNISVYISKYRDISRWQSQRYQHIPSLMLIVLSSFCWCKMLGLRNGVVQLHEAIGPRHSSDPTFYTNKMNFYMGSLPFSIWLLISTEQSTFTHTNLILSTYCESETKMHQWGGSWNKPMEIFAPGLYLWQTQFDGDGLTDGLRGASSSCCVGALQLHSCIVVRSVGA